MNGYNVIDGFFKVLEVAANLAIMGLPVWVIMLLDRDDMKEKAQPEVLLAGIRSSSSVERATVRPHGTP